MGDPEFRSDEQVLVRTKGIHVKSIPFEGILTTRRIVLVDRAKNILPPKEIPLATIKEAEPGENASHDQILTLSVIAKTGETRQMILTFPRQEGNRARERDEWARIIRESASPSFEQVIRKVIPGADQVQKRAGSSAPPRIEVVNAPSPQYAETPQTTPVKRVVKAGSSAKRIIETGDASAPATAPAVREFDASSLGESVFCTRCGNQVSTDSTFCNRCGSPIVAPASAEPRPVPVPAGATQIIAPDVPLQHSLAWDEEPESVPESRRPAAQQPAQKPAKKGLLSGVFGPKKQRVTSPARAQPAISGTPVSPKKPRSGRSFMPGKKTLIAVGVVVVVILVVAAGALFVYPMLNKGSSGTSSGTTSSSGTTPTGSSSSSSSTLTNTGVASITVKQTTAPVIPVTGVYVSIEYIGSWKGTYGMPSDLQTAIDSGDRYYEVVNATGQVTAAFQKQDSSTKHDLTVNIYRNGAVLATGKTSDSFGKVTVSADVTTGVAQTASATNATAATGNTTVTAKPTTAATAVKTTAPATNTTIKTP
jgi:hypothetical protein